MPTDVIQSSIQNTVQSQVSSPPQISGVSLMLLLSTGNELISPWWSKKRDQELRGFWKKSDHLSGAMYNMTSRMNTIPVKVVARNMSIKSHVAIAEQYTELLINYSQFGEGWSVFFSKFVEDLLGQDNGAFAEIIGPGDPAGPIEGGAISIAHLDSYCCQRTSDPIYPVVYNDYNGKSYKLHFSRVISMSLMPSSDSRMYGVGMCSVSRALASAQNLIDIATYKQEKLGSRPHRQIIVTGGGLDPEDIQTAVQLAENRMGAQNLSRFSKTVALGSRNIPDAKVATIDLASIPDGFDEKESTILGMSVIALAFGTDARDLFPGMEAGASKADAIIQHIKQRGKGAGQIMEMTERAINQKFLPPFLKLSFDYQDDSEDRQAAEISNIRAQQRERDIKNGITNERVERQKMIKSGELTEAQFVELELEDGRLDDGSEVDVLFMSKDKDFKQFLDGVTETNYEQRIDEIFDVIVNSRDASLVIKARQAIAAIKFKFVTRVEEERNKLLQEAQIQGLNQTLSADGKQDQGGSKPPDTSYQQEKFGRKIPKNPVNAQDETQNYQG